MPANLYTYTHDNLEAGNDAILTKIFPASGQTFVANTPLQSTATGYAVITAATQKVDAIAYESITSANGTTFIQAYVSGTFNDNFILWPSSLNTTLLRLHAVSGSPIRLNLQTSDQALSTVYSV